MVEKFKDYSGDFCKDLKLSDFSPPALVKLLDVYSKLYIALDGFWYMTLKDKYSNKEALSCNIVAWEEISKYQIAKIAQGLNIQGHDVETLMKALQLTPWFQHTKYQIEMNGHNFSTLTISYCHTLNALEREGQGREAEICRQVHPMIFQNSASFFNPDIKIKCLKSPPRDNKDGICCKWQFTCNA
jgi:hypothetical protein